MLTYQSVSAFSGEVLPDHFPLFDPKSIDNIMSKAELAFKDFKAISRARKGAFLRAIASEILALGDELLERAHQETALSVARLRQERERTIKQLNLFADLVEKGEWIAASLDGNFNDSTTKNHTDIRKQLEPIGIVAVFGASNFPFAYSAAGGDTASALAAGCGVIVKAHPAHAGTSQLVADAIVKAISKTKMPTHIYQHIHDTGFQIGQQLVTHPKMAAVGFTGSYKGGKALFDLANQRKVPIPVFAEMGSINPVLLLPKAMELKNKEWAESYAKSISLGVGQFCTNPGLLIGINGDYMDEFLDELSNKFSKIEGETMLHAGIAKSFHQGVEEMTNQSVISIRLNQNDDDKKATPVLGTVKAVDFIQSPEFQEEVFGPFTLVVLCKNEKELEEVVASLNGQLTGSVIAEEDDFQAHSDIIDTLKDKVGRIIFNGVSTGVEVCTSMQHGGPFPSTTDSRFTAVGQDAIKRFARPVAYQNFPNSLLPDALKNENPLGIWRKVNGELSKDAVKI